MKAILFKKISIRARVAYGICCLENAIKHFNYSELDWSYLKKLLWSYSSENVGNWHYHMAESTPKSVLFEASYEKKELEYLSEDDYEKLHFLYSKINGETKDIIYYLFWIGTQELYGSIINDSLITLEYLQKIIDIMQESNIPLPQFEPFNKFPITENKGWGRAFSKDEIFE